MCGLTDRSVRDHLKNLEAACVISRFRQGRHFAYKIPEITSGVRYLIPEETSGPDRKKLPVQTGRNFRGTPPLNYPIELKKGSGTENGNRNGNHKEGSSNRFKSGRGMESLAQIIDRSPVSKEQVQEWLKKAKTRKEVTNAK
jgi:hypothetical protein